MGRMKRGEFYEEDESIEDITAAFAGGDKFLTEAAAEPQRGWTASIRLPGRASPGDTYLAPVACVHRS